MGIAITNTYVAVSSQVADAAITNSKLGTDIAIGGRVIIMPNAVDVVGAGTWAVSHNALANYAFQVVNTTSADQDNCTFYCYLSAGTWTLNALVHKDSDRGIIKIYVAGTLVATFDLYNAAQALNQVATQAAIAIATNGNKAILVKVDGKNGASSDYYCSLSALEFVRTA